MGWNNRSGRGPAKLTFPWRFKSAGISERAPRKFFPRFLIKDVESSREVSSVKETQRAETEKRSSARLGYFLVGLAIVLTASATCGAQTRQELATLKGHTDVNSVAFSSDGK